MIVRVGMKVKFDPFEDIISFGFANYRGSKVVGTVVMVNYEHQWFSVEYGKNPAMKTSFKFCDIGRAVKILG